MLYTTIGLAIKILVRLEFGPKNADFSQKWSKICISGTKHRLKTASTIFLGSFEPEKRCNFFKFGPFRPVFDIF